ncbi:MAG TPA: hypothetical protein VEI94_12315 [Candidatus Bathyarchaeia archaeon]|nr:hypothetical protein [Candidatus Bathyarchaeia archaeon]
MATIFLHETHEISGGRMHEFEARFRDGWLPALERDGDARLLWFWHLTHGTGASYQTVSITAFDGWSAWERHVERVREGGDLRPLTRDLAADRREVTGKLLLPTPWSPLRTIDFRARPAPAKSAAVKPTMHLHDTCWPFPGGLDAYVDALGSVFYPQVRGTKMIDVEACWTTCPGTGKFHELLLLQRILDWDRFSHLLTDGEGTTRRGDWMEEGLKHRDRWESKLLRTAAWSPLG